MTPKEDRIIKIVGLIMLFFILFFSFATYMEQVKHPYKDITCDQLSVLTERADCFHAWMPPSLKDIINANKSEVKP